MVEGFILNIAVIIGVILVSMTLHEVMHGFVAYWLGDDTAKLQGRLTLNPVKHIDPFLTLLLPIMLAFIPGAPIFGGAKPVPFNPARVRHDEWGAALVAIAGPLTNFFIAFLVFGIATVMGYNFTSIGYGGSVESLLELILTYGVIINLGFFVFNMIPLPPLDGSRVLYAFAPESVQRGMEAIERYGLIFVFGFVLLASPLIGAFMMTAIGSILQFFIMIFIV
jgi:Zn-dependent protease|tara:strand:+ start:3563 stop:4231 length:669 start_codon:yes stop_codon:yes gene_type:complete